MNASSTLGLERPPFGQFARQVIGLRTNDLEECLQKQRQTGDRLGTILRELGFLTRAQVMEVLRAEAHWVAQALKADLGPRGFPYPAFFSLCMPAFNEQDNIEDTLDSACAILPEFVERFEVVVVDDGSHDATATVVTRYAERAPQVRLERHPQNRGYGAAVTTGLRAARGDLVAFTDSDGQFSFLDLPQLLIRLDGHDAVIGYRYQRADNHLRKLNAWCWGRLIRLVLGVQVRDLDCAFKLFRREVVDCLELTSTGAAINAEILSQCVRGGLKICETPVMHYPRFRGAPTGAALRVILRAFRELPRLYRQRCNTRLIDFQRARLLERASTVVEPSPVLASNSVQAALNTVTACSLPR